MRADRTIAERRPRREPEPELKPTPARSASPLRPFSRSLPMALLRAREAVMRHFRPWLQEARLTEQQWRTLRALDGADGVDATRLAATTFLLAPSLTRILRDLEARGLVRRRPNPADARIALITLTARGHDILRSHGAHSEQVYAAIEARIGAKRLDDLMRLLAEVEAELGAPLES